MKLVVLFKVNRRRFLSPFLVISLENLSTSLDFQLVLEDSMSFLFIGKTNRKQKRKNQFVFKQKLDFTIQHEKIIFR